MAASSANTRGFEAENTWDSRIVRAIARDRDAFASAVRETRLYRLMWVKIKIIDGCNIRCVMCNHWRRDGYRRGALTTGRLLRLADELAACRTGHVNWSGGEPTLRKDLPEIMARMRELGIESSIVTNGTLLTADYAARLRRAGISLVVFSLESADPEIHDREVGMEHAWEKLVAGAGYLTQGGDPKPQLMANTVLTSINVGPGLPDIVPLASRLGITRINLSPVYDGHLTPAERRTLVPDVAQIARFRNEYLPRMRELAKEYRVTVATSGDDCGDSGLVSLRSAGKPVQIMGQFQQADRACYLPYYHCTIDYNGNLAACCHMRDGDGLIGNIRDMSVQEVLVSANATRLRRQVIGGPMPGECLGCAMQISENEEIDEILASTPAM